jgi:hypothetical protein
VQQHCDKLCKVLTCRRSKYKWFIKDHNGFASCETLEQQLPFGPAFLRDTIFLANINSIHTQKMQKNTCSVILDKLYKSDFVLKCRPKFQCCLQFPSLLTLNPTPNPNKKNH